MPIPESEIICVDCGGLAKPLNWFEDYGEISSGSVVYYRCRDCLDRWDVLIE